MPKRKRSQSDLKDVSENTNCSVFTEPTTLHVKINQNNSNFDEQPCFLLQLPLEVLEHIFTYLCPKSLIAITSLNIQKFYHAASKLKSFDFSVCNTVIPSEISLLLTSKRVNYIKALNFNYVFLVRSSDLVQFIVKYKHLTSLSILESGIKFKSLYRILEQCKELQELFWSVTPYESDFTLSFEENHSYGIKKLFLCMKETPGLLEAANYIVEKCSSAKEIFFNYSASPFPLRSRRNTIIFRLHQDLKCPVTMIVDDWEEAEYRFSKPIRDCVKCCSNDEWFLSVKMTSPYFQLVTRYEELSSLSSIADESVQSLILYCNTDTVPVNELDPIKRVTGKALTYLCLKKMEEQTEHESYLDRKRRSTYHQIVPYFVVDCRNIKELMLSAIHFEYTFDLTILCTIKALTTLFIPGCLFKPCCDHIDFEANHNFEKFVKNSKDIQCFSIKGCNTCTFCPDDTDIAVISEWSKLRSLSFVKLSCLVYCHFLRDVADKCVHLKSIELLRLGSSLVDHFLPSLTYVFENSPQLMFVSTTLDNRFSRDKKFWNSVAQAKNLQGLCLMENKAKQTYCKPIIDAVDKLKYLHLFHLVTNCRVGNLEKRISQAMKRNGVKHPDVYIEDNCINYTHCELRHFPLF